jgi:hypothetical protein
VHLQSTHRASNYHVQVLRPSGNQVPLHGLPSNADQHQLERDRSLQETPSLFTPQFLLKGSNKGPEEAKVTNVFHSIGVYQNLLGYTCVWRATRASHDFPGDIWSLWLSSARILLGPFSQNLLILHPLTPRCFLTINPTCLCCIWSWAQPFSPTTRAHCSGPCIYEKKVCNRN